VEDDPDSAQTLALLLRRWGYEVAIANDGPDALDAAPTFQPDVVFLDIALPGMDGCEVARRLRHLPGMAEVLVAAVTGYGHEADVRRCKGAGIDCHFLKPVEPAVLRELLANAEPPSERNKSPDGARPCEASVTNGRLGRFWRPMRSDVLCTSTTKILR
jgi:two-component system CheB/CheR fusion protein